MILIAEDEYEIREAYRELIESHGYETKTFKDGKEIMQFLLKQELNDEVNNKPQLIITDLKMPGRSGDDFIQTFRKLSLTFKEIPILIISGLIEPIIKRNYQSEKKIKLLHKPISGESLIEQINLACSNQ